MLSDAEIIKAAISVASGGQVSAEQYQEFIETSEKESKFIQSGVRIIDGIESSSYTIDTLGIDTRIIRKAVEGEAPAGTQGANIARRTLSPTEYILAFDITDKFLRRNIKKGTADQIIKQLFARQCINDMVDAAINGTATGTPNEDFLNIVSGYCERALADANVNKGTYANGDDIIDVLSQMRDAMPNKWMDDPEKLKFMMSPKNLTRYRDALKKRPTGLGDAMIATGQKPNFDGIEINPVGKMTDNDIFLTMPENLVIGFGLNMTIAAQRQERKRLTEYTVVGEVDANYAISDLLVYYRKV